MESSIEYRRGVESMVLAALLEAHPDRLTESKVRRELTSVESTPDRVSAIGQAVKGLVDVGLVARDDRLLRLTPAALRAGELELGL
jgi:hypothetical protein